MCHLPCVMCHVSSITCHVSRVTSHLSITKTTRVTHPPLGNSHKFHSRVVSKNKKSQCRPWEKNHVFLNSSISASPFDQRSLVHQKALFSRCARQKQILTNMLTCWLNRPNDLQLPEVVLLVFKCLQLSWKSASVLTVCFCHYL